MAEGGTILKTPHVVSYEIRVGVLRWFRSMVEFDCGKPAGKWGLELGAGLR
jgi:hypothetical protein